MPLGDSNAGAPNPALLQFLFSRQDARRKEARQQQLDQAAAVLAQQEDERKGQLHRLKVLTQMQGIRKAQGEFEESQVPRIDAAGQNIQQEITGLGNVMFPEDVTPLPPDPRNLGGTPLPGDQSFASLIQRDDPAGFAKIPQTAATRADINQRNYAPIERSIRQRAAALSEAGLGDPEVLYEQMAEGVFSRSGETEFLRKRELEKTEATEGRAEGRKISAEGRAEGRKISAEERAEEYKEDAEIRAAAGKRLEIDAAAKAEIEEESRQRGLIIAGKDIEGLRAEKTLSRNARQLEEQEIAASKALARARDCIGNAKTLRERELCERTLFGIQARLAQKYNNSLPGELIQNRKDVLLKQDEHDHTVTMRKGLQEIASNPRLLGVGANVSQFFAQYGSIAAELTGNSDLFYEQAKKAGIYTDKVDLDFIESIFVRGKDPITQRDLQTVELQELRLVWVIENINNPNGRTALQEIKNIRQTVRFTGLFTSKAISLARINSAIKFLDSSINSSKRDVSRRSPTVKFDPDGYIIQDNFTAEPFNLLGEAPVVEQAFDTPGAGSTSETRDPGVLSPAEAAKQEQEAVERLQNRGFGNRGGSGG